MVTYMGVFSDTISGFEECGKLIAENKPNEALFSLILTDSLLDIYSHQYARQRIYEKECYLRMRSHLGVEHPQVIVLNKEVCEIKNEINSFDNRLKWYSNSGIIPHDMSQAIRHLHEYRNKYLHRLKDREDDVIAFAKLYFYLYEQLFIAIPVNCYSSTDSDESNIVRDALRECGDSFATKEFRKYLIDKVNEKYAISFSLQGFLGLLEQFLMRKYADIIDSLHFLIDVAEDQQKAKKEIEQQCKVGKIDIVINDAEDNSLFTCTTPKTQEFLGKIRKIKTSQNEFDGLQLFTQLFEAIDKFSQPLFELVFQIDSLIQYRVDVLRGK